MVNIDRRAVGLNPIGKGGDNLENISAPIMGKRMYILIIFVHHQLK